MKYCKFNLLTLLFLINYCSLAQPPELKTLNNLLFTTNIDTISNILEKCGYQLDKTKEPKGSYVFKKLDWDFASEELLIFMDTSSFNEGFEKILYISGRNKFFSNFRAQIKKSTKLKRGKDDVLNKCRNSNYFSQDIIYTLSACADLNNRKTYKLLLTRK